jgi:hypothetical protein
MGEVSLFHHNEGAVFFGSRKLNELEIAQYLQRLGEEISAARDIGATSTIDRAECWLFDLRAAKADAREWLFHHNFGV